jgi:hypothetical protein
LPLLDIPAELSAASPPTSPTPTDPRLVPPPVDDQGIADFSSPRRRVRFRIDDEVFEGPRELPAEHALRFIAKAEHWRDVPRDQAPKLLGGMFEEVLLPESLTRFRARLSDPDHPVGLMQIPRIITWLFEQYGMRPTVGLPDSSNGSGSPAAGTPSTAAPPPSAPPTPDGSPSPGS